MQQEAYMKLALEQAVKGCGWTNPNPMVGAVIVKNDRIIGVGHHEKYGQLHAERNALKNCKEDPKGATIYVTLEPCCHHGKTPPCTDAIIESGITTVVVGSLDPNPKVAGNGIRILREHGIQVIEGFMQEECDAINEVFFHYITHGIPYVVMKYAMTADGKIATHTGASRWITGEEARNHVQTARHRYAGIMVGVETVLKDDPMLNCRLPDGNHPIRIICDTHLRTPEQAQIVSTAREIPTILATCSTDSDRISRFEEKGCRVLTIQEKNGHVDLQDLMHRLGSEKIDSILLEGGGTLNYSALEAGIVDRIQAYIAPVIFGGEGARTPVEGQGVVVPADGFRLKNRKMSFWGEDILLEWEVEKKCLPEL